MQIHEKIWRESLAKTGGLDRVIPGIEARAEEFFIPDKINPLSFVANFQILLASQAAAPPAPSAEPTPSVRAFLPADSRPSGFPLWFIAAYPDICLWLRDQKDRLEEFWANLLIQAFGTGLREDFKAQDEQGHLKKELLRKLVDHYLAQGKKLECAYPNELNAEVRSKKGGRGYTILWWIAAAVAMTALILFVLQR